MYQVLCHQGNRDVSIMSVTFGKRGTNIQNRHVTKYQELMAEWSRDGIFTEGITMTERGGTFSAAVETLLLMWVPKVL